MVTARSSRLPRARSSAGLLHLLGLTLLLLALACAHGTGGSHTTADHATPHHTSAPGAQPAEGGTTRAGAAPAGSVVTGGAVVERHDPAHPVHECVPLPPRAAPGADVPPAPAAPVEGCAPADAPSRSGAAGAALPSGAAAPAPPGGSAVLRV